MLVSKRLVVLWELGQVVAATFDNHHPSTLLAYCCGNCRRATRAVVLIRELEQLGVKVKVSEIKIAGKGVTGKGIYTDFDVVTDIGVIQVKTGGGKGFAKQMAVTKEVVDGLPIAAFDANRLAGIKDRIKPSVAKQLADEGHFLTDDVAALVDFLRKGK